MLFRCMKGAEHLSVDLKGHEVQCSGNFQAESMWHFVIMPYKVGPPHSAAPLAPGKHVHCLASGPRAALSPVLIPFRYVAPPL
jgi:hypothetical protein